MHIGVLGAMPEEVALLQEGLDIQHMETVADRPYWVGRLYDRDVVLAVSRMGKVAAASTATRLIEHHDVGLLICCGVAGAAAIDLDIGDVVVSNELVQYDMDASPLFPQFEIPLIGRARIPVDTDLVDGAVTAANSFLRLDMENAIPADIRRELRIANPRALAGLIASGDQFLSDVEDHQTLRRLLPDVKCVEMEGAAAAQVCFEHGVPCVVIRTISDRADSQAAVDFTKFVDGVASVYIQGILKRFFELF